MTVGPAVVAVACLCAAAPPGWFPGAGLLVFPGWMAFYWLVRAEGLRRRGLAIYVVGLVHMLVFSASVRFVLLPAYLAIGLVGGLYYSVCAVWTRSLARVVPGPLAFALALAGTHWARAHFTEIQYPHGQPVHCLYSMPWLLGSLQWGSELLGNLLIGALAAAGVDLLRRPAGGASRRRAAWVAAGVVGVAALASSLSPRGAITADAPEKVSLLLLEPRFGADVFFSRRFEPLLAPRVVVATNAELARGAPPDLVVWPESILMHLAVLEDGLPRVRWRPEATELRLPPATRLLAGSMLLREPRDPAPWVLGLLTDARGNYLDHHEKRRRVPGGEHAPFLDLLPGAVADWIRASFENAFGVPVQEISPGRSRPPLRTGSGVPFGAMVCFDNAFPEPTEDLVRQGARFLVVLSNEAWYRGGAELDQMVAMTVCRAIECGIGIARCTVDGATAVVTPDGRVAASLPWPGPPEASGFLRYDLPLPPVGQPAVPPLHRLLVWLLAVAALALLPPVWGSCGRLFRRRSEPATTR